MPIKCYCLQRHVREEDFIAYTFRAWKDGELVVHVSIDFEKTEATDLLLGFCEECPLGSELRVYRGRHEPDASIAVDMLLGELRIPSRLLTLPDDYDDLVLLARGNRPVSIEKLEEKYGVPAAEGEAIYARMIAEGVLEAGTLRPLMPIDRWMGEEADLHYQAMERVYTKRRMATQKTGRKALF